MRYDDTTKARAIALAVELEDVAAAAHDLGLPRQTVHRWLRDAGVTVTTENREAAVEATKLRWEERRAVMVEEMGEVAQIALQRTRDGLGAGLDGVKAAKDAATTMAILVDKAQLLSGGATGRVYVPPQHAGEVIGVARDRGLSLVAGTD
jgi:transposase-like protein